MCTALNGVDIVYVRMDIFRESCIVLHCNLNRDTCFVCLQINRLLCEFLPCAVEITYKLKKTLLRIECFCPFNLNGLPLIIHLGGPGICNCKFYPLVEVSKFPQPCGKDIITVLGSYGKYLRIRLECDDCTCIFSLAHNFYRV